MALFLLQTLLLVADITSFITFDETSQQGVQVSVPHWEILSKNFPVLMTQAVFV